MGVSCYCADKEKVEKKEAADAESERLDHACRAICIEFFDNIDESELPDHPQFVVDAWKLGLELTC